MFDDETRSGVMKFAHVLVVHDASYDLEEHFAALRNRFIVRTATSIAQAAEVVGSIDIRCVIGVVGGTMTARDLVGTFGSGGRLALLRTRDTSGDDDVFLLTETRCVLLSPTPEEVVAGVANLVERSRQA